MLLDDSSVALDTLLTADDLNLITQLADILRSRMDVQLVARGVSGQASETDSQLLLLGDGEALSAEEDDIALGDESTDITDEVVRVRGGEEIGELD